MGPFYNAIKSNAATSPGTGDFQPGGASTGALAWSNVPAGWIGLVRYEEGTAWELSYARWTGTVLTRSANALMSSSTGSLINLTASATAALVPDAAMLQAAAPGTVHEYNPVPGTTSYTLNGLSAPTTSGTLNVFTPSSGGQPWIYGAPYLQSATTANAMAAMEFTPLVTISPSGNGGVGGFLYRQRFVITNTIPTSARALIGLSEGSYIGQTIDPSAYATGMIAFGKDAADTNIQLITNSGTGSGTKIDTGIPLAASNGAWFEAVIWSNAGSTVVFARLTRLDTGAIFYTSTSTDVPTALNNALRPVMALGLSSVTGTSAQIASIGLHVRLGIL